MGNNAKSNNGYALVVVGLAFTIGFITDGISYSFGILMVELLEQFQEDRAKTSLIISVMQGTRYLIVPVTGALCEKYGLRAVVVIGSLIASTGFFISVFADNILFLTLTYGFLGGLGFGLVYPPGNIYVLQYFKGRLSLAAGVAACGSGIGNFCVSRLLRLLIDYYGWRGTILLQAALVLQCVLCGLLMKPHNLGLNNESINSNENTTIHEKSSNKKDQNSKESGSNVPASNLCIEDIDEMTASSKKDKESGSNVPANNLCVEDIDEMTASSKKDTESGSNVIASNLCIEDIDEMTASSKKDKESGSSENKPRKHVLVMFCTSIFSLNLLKDFRCWLFFLSAALFQLSFTTTLVFLPDQGTRNGLSKDETAWLISAIGISNTVGRVCIGWIGDLHLVNRMILLEVVLLLAGFSTGMSHFLGTFALKLSYTSMFGLLVGGFISLCPVVLTDVFGVEMISKTYGLLMLSVGASDIVSAPIGGLLFDISGSYNVTFIVAGVGFALSGLCLFVLRMVIKCRRPN